MSELISEVDSPQPVVSCKDIEKRLVAKIGKIKGVDSNDKDYNGLTSLWKYIFANKNTKPQINIAGKESSTGTVAGDAWYEQAYQYWESEANCPVSDDGVLGGFGRLTPMDTRDSNLFLDSLLAKFPNLQFNRCADCGAGIGRVTKNLLLPRFREVDLVEQSPRLLQSAASYCEVSKHPDKTVRYINTGLQTFAPEPNTYDVVWIQWVIGHLHDPDCILFLRRCLQGLTPHGVVILKDNCILDPKQAFCLDVTDNSVCRNIAYFEVLFELAGCEVVSRTVQRDFPSELFPVLMFALRPKAQAQHKPIPSASVGQSVDVNSNHSDGGSSNSKV